MDIPGYKIIDTLGEGGMATVYLAIQESFERKVALKVMSSTLLKDPSFGERFIREARIVSHLVHPNIVTVYDVGVHDNFHFLSMEYVPGNDLKHLRFDLSLEQQLQSVKDIARALDYAGRKGYVHRDVKPENIMIHEEDGRSVLMDFGIARATDVSSGMTQTGTTMGTPHYMSPEQAKGAKVDPRCDLYGLGIVLFQLITGHVPFDADSAVAVGIMHVSEAVPRLPAHLQVFQFIIDRVLAKRPEERYQRGNEFIADLETITPAQIADIKRTMNTVLHIDTVDDNAATVVSAAVTESSLDAEKAITLKNKPQAKTKASTFSINATDRIGDLHAPTSNNLDTDEAESQGFGWGWVLLVLLAALGGGYYWWMQQQNENNALPAPLATSVTLVSSARSVSSSSIASSIREQSSVSAENSGSVSKAETLLQRLPGDLSSVPLLVELYKSMQSSTFVGEQQAAIVGLEELTRVLNAAFNDAINESNISKATQVASILKSTFPNTLRDDSFAQKLSGLNDTVWLTEQLAMANSFLQSNALGSPKGANALETYQQILSKYPNQADALTGINAITTRYYKLAEAQLKQNKPRAAATLITRGLAIQAGNEPLLALQKQVTQASQEQQQLRAKEQALLIKANTLLVEDKLVSPKGDNAFEAYQSVLALNASQSQAKKGLAQIERQLSFRIESLINNNTLGRAALQIARAQDHFPQSASLFALQIQLDDQVQSQQPVVSRILISGQEIVDINALQVDPLQADRIIHIGFSYINFVGGTNVVQAVLFDGSRSLKIAQTSVIVNNSEGVKYFYIERPVVGFPEGGYHVDLLLGTKRLGSVVFNVDTHKIQENDATL